MAMSKQDKSSPNPDFQGNVLLMKQIGDRVHEIVGEQDKMVTFFCPAVDVPLLGARFHRRGQGRGHRRRRESRQPVGDGPRRKPVSTMNTDSSRIAWIAKHLVSFNIGLGGVEISWVDDEGFTQEAHIMLPEELKTPLAEDTEILQFAVDQLMSKRQDRSILTTTSESELRDYRSGDNVYIRINGRPVLTTIDDEGCQRFRLSKILIWLMEHPVSRYQELDTLAKHGRISENDRRFIYMNSGITVQEYSDHFPNDVIDNPLWRKS